MKRIKPYIKQNKQAETGLLCARFARHYKNGKIMRGKMKRIVIAFIMIFSFTFCSKHIEAQNQSQSDRSDSEPEPQLVRTTNDIVPNGLDEEHSIRYYMFDTGIAGPSIVIIGGVHGNEPAPPRAAMHIVDNFEFSCGRFLIIPGANPAALAADTRTTPGYPIGDASDLNRQFPGNENGSTTQRIAAALTGILDDFNPDVVIDLHEAIMGYDWSTTGPMPHVIFFANPIGNAQGAEAANSVVEAINRTELVNNARNFRARRGGMAGLTSTEFSRRFNIPAFLIETGRPLSDDVNPLDLRIEQHLFLVNALVQLFANDCHPF